MKKGKSILTTTFLVIIIVFSIGCGSQNNNAQNTTSIVPIEPITDTTMDQPTSDVKTDSITDPTTGTTMGATTDPTTGITTKPTTTDSGKTPTENPTKNPTTDPTTPIVPTAPTTPTVTKETIEEFEAEYKITVKDEAEYLDDSKLIKTISLLDSALQEFSAPAIRKLVNEFEKDGREFTIYIMKPTQDYIQNIITAYAINKPDRLGIELYIPENNYPGGIDKPTIVHEFGHFVHYALERNMGKQTFKNRFTAFNNGEKYDQLYTYNDEYMFATNYGSEDYYEDVATVFEILGSNNKKVNKLGNKQYKPLLNKVKFLEKYSTEYFNMKLPLFNIK